MHLWAFCLFFLFVCVFVVLLLLALGCFFLVVVLVCSFTLKKNLEHTIKPIPSHEHLGSWHATARNVSIQGISISTQNNSIRCFSRKKKTHKVSRPCKNFGCKRLLRVNSHSLNFSYKQADNQRRTGQLL